MRLVGLQFAASFQLTCEKKVSMVDLNYGGFQANALEGSEVRASFVVMNCASRSSGHAPTSPSLRSNC